MSRVGRIIEVTPIYNLHGGIGLITFGLLLILIGHQIWRQRRKIIVTKTKKIKSATEGLTEIQGFAWPSKQMVCLEGKTICYYCIEMQQPSRSSWMTLHSKSSTDPIIAIDDTGFCLINPMSAKFEVETKAYKVRDLSPSQAEAACALFPELREYIEPPGQELIARIFSTNGRIRILEKKILAGSPLYVLGHFNVEPTQKIQSYGMITEFKKHFVDQNIDSIVKISRIRRQKKLRQEVLKNFTEAAIPSLRANTSEAIEIQGTISKLEKQDLVVADSHEHYLLDSAEYKDFIFYYIMGFSVSLAGIGVTYLLIKRYLKWV